MAVVNTLAADQLSLRGADQEYHKFSRIFRTKAEGLDAINLGDWVPTVGVLNICMTGDVGLQVYDPNAADTVDALVDLDSSAKNYVDSQIGALTGGSPEALNTLQELSAALNNDPNYFNTISNRIGDIEDGYDFTGRITAPVTGNVVPAYFDSVGDFPDATSVHGAVVHGHAEGAMYYAHAGGWQRIANQSEVTDVNDIVNNVRASLGALPGETDMGTFTGSIISDTVSAKTAIQELETAVEAISPTSGVMVQAHGSFDASSGGSFDFATNGIASFGVTTIVRNSTGNFTVTFSSAFASANYTVVAQAGDQDYSGVGASPRSVCVTNRTTTTVDLIVERTDDAVNDDNGYIAFMVMGTLA